MGESIPTWDLSSLYPSLDSIELSGDLSKAEAAFARLDKRASLLAKGCEASSVLPLLQEFDEAALAFSTPATYIALRAMVEPASQTLSRLSGRSDRVKYIQDQLWNSLLRLLSAASDIQAALDREPQLAPYRFFISEYRRLAAHRPAPKQQALLKVMQRNGGQAWMSLRNQLDAAAAAPLSPGGAVLPLSALRSLASSPDGETRRRAYEAELRLYPTYEIPMAACLNGIKGEALEELPYKHYPSVEAEMLDTNKISQETLDSMFRSLEEHLPHFRSYLKKKSELLGHTNGMPWYDLLAPMDGIPAGFSFQEAQEMLTKALSSFSPSIGQLAEQAFQKRWIDALPAEGKQGGAICVDLPGRKEVRILTNYSGSFRCIRTIAHELGHAYHARCLDHLPLLLRDAPTPICETASLMNEVIFLNQTLDRLPDRQRFALLESDLQESTQTVLDIYSRYLFEKEVFARRTDHALMPNELCQLMENAQKAVFGDALNENCLHPYMWMCKVHYYIPEFHYYNYPYIFGLLFAKGLYAQYLAHPDGFAQTYRQLLSSTCSGSMEDIAAKAGVDIRCKSFWDSALDLIVSEIDQWFTLADQ